MANYYQPSWIKTETTSGTVPYRWSFTPTIQTYYPHKQFTVMKDVPCYVPFDEEAHMISLAQLLDPVVLGIPQQQIGNNGLTWYKDDIVFIAAVVSRSFDQYTVFFSTSSRNGALPEHAATVNIIAINNTFLSVKLREEMTRFENAVLKKEYIRENAPLLDKWLET